MSKPWLPATGSTRAATSNPRTLPLGGDINGGRVRDAGCGPLVFRWGRRRTANHDGARDSTSNMSLILLIIVLLLVFGSAPTWGYSRNWGYGPSGGLGLILLILLLLYLTGHLNF